VLGQPVDARSDVFSLGVVMWEMLTGRRLFKRDHDAATINAVSRCEVPLPHEYREKIPEPVEQVVMKALAKRPEDRYACAADMSDALHVVLKDIGSVSSKEIRLWITDLFGERRAERKKEIAQGRGLESVANEKRVRLTPEQAADLGVVPVPNGRVASSSSPSQSSPGGAGSNPSKPGPSSSDPAMFSSAGTMRANANEVPRTWRAVDRKKSSSSGAQFFEQIASNVTPVVTSTAQIEVEPFRPKPWMLVAGFAGLLALTSGITAFVLRGESVTKQPTLLSFGQLGVSSEPQGAEIFIDGKSQGLFTPSTVRDLPVDRPVKLRLEAPHYRPYETEVMLDPKQRVDRSVRMSPLHRVRFEIPPGTELWIDGTAVPSTSGPVEVPLGKIRVELRRDGRTIESKSIEISGREETIPLGG
jgi:hypothetical protein